MLHTVTSFEDDPRGMLAFARPPNQIHIKKGVQPQDIFNHLQGLPQNPHSLQKAQVLEALTLKGWPLKKIQTLIKTPADAKRFLLLHELSHLTHQDHKTYKHLNAEEKIQVETRATLDALKTLHKEKTPNQFMTI